MTWAQKMFLKIVRRISCVYTVCNDVAATVYPRFAGASANCSSLLQALHEVVNLSEGDMRKVSGCCVISKRLFWLKNDSPYLIEVGGIVFLQ